MTAWYNEIDPYVAAWLQNLMDAGHIARGVIDTRSIEDVSPADLRGFTQCHFFAGIGGWSLALRLAGWPDDRPAWTGSCPCQPFSAAGKGAGFADERHLWPSWQHLIAELRPSKIFGEQVASKAVDTWIDLVHADMEGMGYAFGSIPFPAAGVGAPHIRDRNYWMAHADHAGLEGRWLSGECADQLITRPRSVVRGLGNSNCQSTGRNAGGARCPQAEVDGSNACHGDGFGDAGGELLRMADTDGGHAGAERQQRSGEHGQQPQDCGVVRLADADRIVGGQGRALDGGRHHGSDAQSRARLGGGVLPNGQRPGPTNGQWRDADWIGCTDGKFRPVESTHECLADGLSESLGYVRTGESWSLNPLIQGGKNRVGRLRAYGNAIIPEQAAQFIGAYLDIERNISLEPSA